MKNERKFYEIAWQSIYTSANVALVGVVYMFVCVYVLGVYIYMCVCVYGSMLSNP